MAVCICPYCGRRQRYMDDEWPDDCECRDARDVRAERNAALNEERDNEEKDNGPERRTVKA